MNWQYVLCRSHNRAWREWQAETETAFYRLEELARSVELDGTGKAGWRHRSWHKDIDAAKRHAAVVDAYIREDAAPPSR